MKRSGRLVNSNQVDVLIKRTGCKRHDALVALDLREGIEEFAVEYLQQRDLPLALSEPERYPKFYQYLQQKKRY